MSTFDRAFRTIFRSRNDGRMRPRIDLQDDAQVTYAIGDIHGRLDLLLKLEAKIAADAEVFPGSKRLIMLGDYIDRGPSSAQVVQHLIDWTELRQFEHHFVAGNHEMMMLKAMEHWSALERWLTFGGLQTLRSYGIAVDQDRTVALRHALDRIPREHVDFLQMLPIYVRTPRYLFVHAGAAPSVPLEQQSDEELTEMRPHDDAARDRTLVHGHTIVERVQVMPLRISVDTGAFATGRLAAVRLVASEQPAVLYA